MVSQIVKFLEGIILEKLKNYNNNQMDSAQHGFRKGHNIDLCKAQVIKHAKELLKTKYSNKKERPRMVFFDLKSAYDKVNRSKLYSIILEKGILNRD